jgi:hypothetical protein
MTWRRASIWVDRALGEARSEREPLPVSSTPPQQIARSQSTGLTASVATGKANKRAVVVAIGAVMARPAGEWPASR